MAKIDWKNSKLDDDDDDDFDSGDGHDAEEESEDFDEDLTDSELDGDTY